MATIGIVGLGRMGGSMAQRVRDAGHHVLGFDPKSESSDVTDLDRLVEALPQPRMVWVMVPAGEPTRTTIEALSVIMAAGDLVIDGGNTHYTDDETHAAILGARGIALVDCGVSGGIWGRDEGYALMCGGAPEHVARVQPIFDALTPDGGGGFVHVGPTGAGHFAKMVHNGIEYGMMQSLAEGWELLEKVPLVTDVRAVYQAWQRGTVIRSWLLDLAVLALEEDEHLDATKGYARDSGEGRWAIEAALEYAVPLPAITAAMYARFASRQDDLPAMRMIAALRKQFGGHATTTA